MMITIWSFVAVICFFYYTTVPNLYHLQLWPFLYLFLGFTLYNRFFFKKQSDVLNVTKFTEAQNRVIDYICYFYIFCVIINILSAGYDLSSFSLSNVQENASDSYDQFHTADAWHSNSLLERVTVNYAVWFMNVAIIGGFNWLVRGKISQGLGLLGILVLDQGMKNIQIAARGSLFFFVLLLIAVYLIYKDYIERKTRRSLIQLAAISGGVLFLYVLAITISRFADSDSGSSGSLFMYFGQSMLNFNYGVADSLNGTYMGARTFRNILGLQDYSFNADIMLGTHVGTGFTTVIGSLCLDFGFIGTIVLGIVLPWLLMRLIKFDNSIGGVYIYIFYFHRMMNGVFVNGPGADSAYISMLIVYMVLFISMRLTMRKKKKQNKIFVAKNEA